MHNVKSGYISLACISFFLTVVIYWCNRVTFSTQHLSSTVPHELPLWPLRYLTFSPHMISQNLQKHVYRQNNCMCIIIIVFLSTYCILPGSLKNGCLPGQSGEYYLLTCRSWVLNHKVSWTHITTPVLLMKHWHFCQSHFDDKEIVTLIQTVQSKWNLQFKTLPF